MSYDENKVSDLIVGGLIHQDISYLDLLSVLHDCIQVLKVSDVEENMIETWSNTLMNAENMWEKANQNYEDGCRLADNETEELW